MGYTYSSSSYNSARSSISGGIIAIIIIAIIIVIVKVAVIVWCCTRASRRNAQRNNMANTYNRSNAQAGGDVSHNPAAINSSYDVNERPVWSNDNAVYRPLDMEAGRRQEGGGVAEPLPVYQKERPVEELPGYQS